MGLMVGDYVRLVLDPDDIFPFAELHGHIVDIDEGIDESSGDRAVSVLLEEANGVAMSNTYVFFRRELALVYNDSFRRRLQHRREARRKCLCS